MILVRFIAIVSVWLFATTCRRRLPLFQNLISWCSFVSIAANRLTSQRCVNFIFIYISLVSSYRWNNIAMWVCVCVHILHKDSHNGAILLWLYWMKQRHGQKHLWIMKIKTATHNKTNISHNSSHNHSYICNVHNTSLNWCDPMRWKCQNNVK